MAETRLETFPYDGVSFDMDGTLYSLDHFMVNLGMRRTKDVPMWMAMEKARMRARRSGIAVEDMSLWVEVEMAKALGLPVEEVTARVTRMIDEDWPWLLTKVGPFRRVEALLETLVRKGVPILVNSDYPGAKKVRALGLGEVPWVAILDATSFGALKPRPEVFSAAAEAFGAQPSRVLHVGDSPELDIQGANAAQLHSVLVGKKKPDRQLPSQVPTYRYRSMNRFCDALIGLLEGPPGRK